jgi:putative endonuclease
MPKLYYVYILASQRRVLYIGMTSNIEQRVFQHKTHAVEGFTTKYNVTNLFYFERHGSVLTAIRREKELKAWRREEKIKLIESTNPKWRDLSYGWFQRHRYQPYGKVIEGFSSFSRCHPEEGDSPPRDRTKRVKRQCSR